MASVACTCPNVFRPPKQQAARSAESAALQVSEVGAGRENEVLAALTVPSLTNVIMAGFVHDNTLDSPLNRGRFYICHSEHGELEGVGLIGHTILINAFSRRALEALAAVARREASPHLLMGDRNTVQSFWHYYAGAGMLPRHVCPILFLHRTPFTDHEQVPGLRLAAREDLEHVVQAQAAMVRETSGVDPLAKDPTGFRERYVRRIEKRRVWVLIENDRLVFKTDVIADTADAVYIEGVYVKPEERGKGIGQRCLTQAGHSFLGHTKAIYLFVENEEKRTRSFYNKLGFKEGGQYDLLFF
jgi:ribosomal protein S18 acetylase RimI-like enzyme